jgi:hypothetical protein
MKNRCNAWQSIVLILMLLTASAIQASAAEKMFLAGIEASGGETGTYYGHAGLVLPFPGSTLGGGLVHRYWLDYQGYNYEGSGSQKIDATVLGGEAAMGYQVSGPKGWTAFYAGLRVNDTDLSPDDPTSKVRGTQLRLKVLAEGEREFIPAWFASASTSYVFGNKAYWVRGRLEHKFSNSLRTGPEVITHGDPDYRVWQVGWVLGGIRLIGKSDLMIKGGARFADGMGPNGYAGIEFTTTF